MKDKFCGIRISSLTRRRINTFCACKKSLWCLRIFAVLFVISLFSEFIANDKPLLVRYESKFYFPVFKTYLETDFGGDIDIEADYYYLADEMGEKGWMVWPLIRFGCNTIDEYLDKPAPSSPSWRHLLGTDDQGRDVVARALYGFRISVLFGLCLTAISAFLGVLAGAIQGYFGGWIDLLGQRLIEIWSSIPMFLILIILASFIVPNFWWLLGLMVLFSWTALVFVVRAEFLRARKLDYVRAAKALGVSDFKIIYKHVLPNAMVAAITLLPFNLCGAVTTLTALDFLGFGLPLGSPSLGELLAQGKANLHAPWLGIVGFYAVFMMITLLVFIQDGLRNAFDPRKVYKTDAH